MLISAEARGDMNSILVASQTDQGPDRLKNSIKFICRLSKQKNFKVQYSACPTPYTMHFSLVFLRYQKLSVRQLLEMEETE